MQDALSNARAALWSEYDEHAGHWHGELSSSALSTAIVVFALSQIDTVAHAPRVRAGLAWLVGHQNDDGGWGDTVDSPSNITATVLCRAALTRVPDGDAPGGAAAARADRWLAGECGSTGPADIAPAILAHYGDDKTFAVPILTMCALAGLLGPDDEAWAHVVQLPFELSLFPAGLYRWLSLRVVSYALPALIAMGLARHRKRPSKLPGLRGCRERSAARALAIAAGMQPSNGGYEEATPLTAFVAMALVAAGEGSHAIVQRAAQFLVATVRPDGSWPIDTSLATWVTVLSVTALTDGGSTESRPPGGRRVQSSRGGRDSGEPGLSGLCPDRRRAIRAWLLAQQHADVHPLTSEGLGGWAWSHLPGAMPDADDTAGVLVALRRLGDVDATSVAAAERGIGWLLSIQNRDGGIPTFCRGWGKLPFDRSCPDITAHTMRALLEWRDDVAPGLRRRMRRSLRRCVSYLQRVQRDDGSWVPLWFGNQHADTLENPAYGTAQVVIALLAIRELGVGSDVVPALEKRGVEWLLAAQHEGGGWGGAPGLEPTLEETGLVLRALAGSGHADALRRGVAWLVEHTQSGTAFPASPIGLYFAKLWYSDRLYPVVFTTWALEALAASADLD